MGIRFWGLAAANSNSVPAFRALGELGKKYTLGKIAGSLEEVS